LGRGHLHRRHQTPPIVAGNAPAARVDKLRGFWESITDNPLNDWAVSVGPPGPWRGCPQLPQPGECRCGLAGGAAGFSCRACRPMAASGRPPSRRRAHGHALKATLERFVDFDRINRDGRA